MIEAKYVCRVTVQPFPDLNLLWNPTAEKSLNYAAGVGVASLARQTGDTVNLNTRTGTGYRLNGSASTNDSFLTVATEPSGGGPLNGFEPGKLYTVSANYFASAALAGTAHARARRIVVFHRIGAAAFTEVQSPQAPNAAGNVRLSVSFTLPAGTTEAFVRYYHGHAGAGTMYWHSLRIAEGAETDYFDGGAIGAGGTTFLSTEYGWDHEPGESPAWRVDRTQNVTIPDAEIDSISYDGQRVPWIEATITAPIPAANILDMLDPLRPRDVILNYRVDHYTRGFGGELTQHVSASPYLNTSTGAAGKLWLRDLETDELSQTITLTAASGEVRLEDTKLIAAAPRDSNASTGRDLFQFAVKEAGEAGSVVYTDLGAVTLAIPAGDRRKWLPGQSLSDVFEAELAAIELRGYCDDVGNWHVRGFTDPPGHAGAGITLEDGNDGNLYAYRRKVSRAGEWRDATLVRSQYVDGAGVQQTAWQAYPASGRNRKGAMATMDRAIPSSTYARTVTERAAARGGESYQLEAQLDFRVRAGRPVAVTVAGVALGSVLPDRVTYRPQLGIMQIEGTPA